jgi:DMSO/TMAO reductase YedYZ heme-binding membrane subunit
LKVQSKGSSTNKLIFILLKQGVDESSNVTTWWSTYLGCNTNLVCFNYGIQKHHFFICIFSPWKQNKYSLFVMTLWVPNMIFIIYEMQFGIEMFVDMFLKINLKIFCIIFILPHKITFFHYFLHLQLKLKIVTNIWCQNSMQI